jgi:hypothetical protein
MSEFPGENPMSPGGAELATNGDVATMMENFQTKKTSAASMINRLNCGPSAGAPASIPAVSAANAVVTSPASVVAGSRMKRSSQVITDIYSHYLHYLHMYDVPVPVSSSRYRDLVAQLSAAASGALPSRRFARAALASLFLVCAISWCCVLAVQIRAARVPFPSVVFRNECEQARICPRYQGRWWIFSAQVDLLLTIIIKTWLLVCC